MTFDGILQDLGEFGPYQRRVFFLVSLVAIPCAFGFLSPVFLAGESDHWCATPEFKDEDCSRWPELTPSQCEAAIKDASIPPQTNPIMGYTYDNCLRYNLTDVPFYPGIDTKEYTNDTLSCDAGWQYNTSQYHSTILTEFNIVCTKSSLNSLSTSIFFAGVLVGSLLFGMLSDWIGRYYSFFIAVALFFCSNLAVAFSPNIIAFCVFRFLVGVANIGSFILAFVVATELVGPSRRVVTGIGIQFFWATGYMLLALLAYLIRDWFVLQLVLTAPLPLMFLFIPFVKESPRWLMSRGRFDEAEAIITDIARVNKATLPDKLFHETEIEKTISDNKGKQPSIIDLFRTPSLRWRTINLMYNWFVHSIVYYGLSLSTSSLGGNIYVAIFLSGLVEVPANLLAVFGIQWFGRKPNLCGLLILGGVACFGTLIVSPGTARTAIAMTGRFCITATFGIIYVYSGEIFPTPVRSAGIGLCSVSSHIGAILSPIFLLLGDYWAPLPLVVFGSSSIIAGLLVVFLPETKGRRLPESIAEVKVFGRVNTENDHKLVPKQGKDVVNGNTNPAFDPEKS